jgi:hypothetical protein
LTRHDPFAALAGPISRDYVLRHEFFEGQELAVPRVKANLNAFEWLARGPTPPSVQDWLKEEEGYECLSFDRDLPAASPGKLTTPNGLAAAPKFRRLADQWLEETQLTSSLTEIVLHSAYQQIIGMGNAALPLILRELQERPAHWFWALRAITGENPVPREDAGRMARMTEHWLDWGRQHGFLR